MDATVVERWLADISLPAPSAVDVAAHVARFVGVPDWASKAREGMLMVAKLLMALDAHLRVQREATHQACVALYAANRATQDVAHTAMVACERLAQQKPLIDTALAIHTDPHDGARLADFAVACDAYQQIVARQS